MVLTQDYGEDWGIDVRMRGGWEETGELADEAGQGVAADLAFFSSDDLERGEGCSGKRGRGRGGEDEGSAAVDEVCAESSASRGEATGGAEGLAKGSDEDVRGHSGLVAESAAARSLDTEGMGLVNDEGSAVLPGEGGEFGNGCGVTVHSEEGLGDNELAACGGSKGTQALLGRGGVPMLVEGGAGAGETAGVDDAGVVGVVAEDKVPRGCEGGDDAEVGLISGGEEEDILGVEEGG
jgi:hypothetical protein